MTAASARPSVAFGVTAGDVDLDRAIVWSRTDRAARLIVEYATTESFKDARRVVGPAALEASDFTARVDLSGLPAGQRIFYRATFQSLHDITVSSEPMTGTFTTPQTSGTLRDVTVAWTADTVGQGWGINAEMGGMRLYQTMQTAGADVFIHTGDTIYADGPLQAEVKLDDGRVWRNLVTPEKSKVAETLDEFRGNHRYNLLDEHVRRFNASVSQFVIWDDHEVLEQLVSDGGARGREPLHRAQRRAAGGARQARVPRIHAGTARRDRSGANLPCLPVWSAPRHLRVRHAQLPWAQHDEPPGPRPRTSRRSSVRRRSRG